MCWASSAEFLPIFSAATLTPSAKSVADAFAFADFLDQLDDCVAVAEVGVYSAEFFVA